MPPNGDRLHERSLLRATVLPALMWPMPCAPTMRLTITCSRLMRGTVVTGRAKRVERWSPGSVTAIQRGRCCAARRSRGFYAGMRAEFTIRATTSRAGRGPIDVAARCPTALLFARQAAQHRPRWIAVTDSVAARQLDSTKLPPGCELLTGSVTMRGTASPRSTVHSRAAVSSSRAGARPRGR